jgi:hypothetical protein
LYAANCLAKVAEASWPARASAGRIEARETWTTGRSGHWPEGGFIEREVETFQEIGFTAVSLGRESFVWKRRRFLIGRLF